MYNYIKSAIDSIWANKVRSVLTVLGVVIGVTSVSILISIGQGLKNDVSDLIQGLGSNVIVVLTGKLDTSSQQQTNPASFIAVDILTLQDVSSISALEDIDSITPVSPVTGELKYDDKTAVPFVAGVYPEVLDAFQVTKIDQGSIFDTSKNESVIVVGHDIKVQLFGDKDPIGKKVVLGKDNEFTVIGTLAKSTSGASFGGEINSMSFIPFDSATALNKNQIKVFRMIIKASNSADVKVVKKNIHTQLLNNHDGVEDFTVLTQDDILDVFGQFLNLATALVSAIAAISLVVGGIGIMNIMLVTVTERTREIGLRKAVGATKQAILWQFLVEAVIITFLGGLIGLAITFAASAVIASQTELQPDITLDVILIAVGISTTIGITFGLWPALRAANKDPIDALRYE
jgi:putative ABC transport system permease protein